MCISEIPLICKLEKKTEIFSVYDKLAEAEQSINEGKAIDARQALACLREKYNL